MELLHWRIHFYIFNYAAVLQNLKIQTQLPAPALRCGTAPELHSAGRISFAGRRLYKNI